MTHLVRRLTAAGTRSLCLATLLSCPLAQAQTPPAAAASSAAGGDANISDRVKKDAASPLYWIRLNAQKNDSAPPKAAPRIAEIRPAPAPARPAAPATASTGGGGGATAAAPNASVGSTAPANTTLASANQSTASLAAPNAAAANLATTVGAGMVAPAASSAADAARTAAAAADADEPLALVKAEEPEFPIIVMRRLRKGSVQVRFDVQLDGSVTNVSVVESSARSLNDAALAAVRGWQFKPVSSPRSAVVDLGFDLDS